MKITVTAVTRLISVYSVPCGTAFLCGHTADFEDPWLAESPEADEQDPSLATEEEVADALVVARGIKLEYFKMDGDEGIELADGEMWSAATRIARVTFRNGDVYYSVEDEGGSLFLDEEVAAALLPNMITDENPPASLVREAVSDCVGG